MNKIVAIQADPIEKINPKTDTTLLLALEAQKRKYRIYWFEAKDLSFINSKLFADVKELRLFGNDKKYFKIIRKKKFNLSSSKVILIRQDPPFNNDYINSTLLLDSIKNRNLKIYRWQIFIQVYSYPLHPLKGFDILSSFCVGSHTVVRCLFQ